MHRVDLTREEDVRQIRVQYFQYSKTTAERQIHALTPFHIFVTLLDVFSEFLALEHKIVRKEWQFEVIRIGKGAGTRCRPAQDGTAGRDGQRFRGSTTDALRPCGRASGDSAAVQAQVQ